MAKARKFLEGVKHGRSCYVAGCDCAVGRQANSEYLKDYRARKRAEQLEAAGVQLLDVEPPEPEPETTPADPPVVGPIEQALADDLARNDGTATYLEQVAVTVARSLDMAVRTYRLDLISPLAQRLVDVGVRLWPPAPAEPAGDDKDKRAELLLLMGGEGQTTAEPEAAGGA
ncbi:hypothetical protein APR04_003792 [Promicromonospora umidemergens]|uniref:Terminase small subunit n=1 Tax=Promicromonospora umidemergens TaxID=629679 RepID=A0ABP8XG16_9MICO|nr:hypothetical protein [Promicromonospora umidemergens]MCP2284869.1 hypothetical protein [Promicromonospora umidemergens]